MLSLVPVLELVNIHPRGHLCAHHTVGYFSRSVSAAEDSRKASSEPSSTSKEKSNKEKVSSSPRTPTALRITTGKLSSHRVSPLQLSAALSLSTPKRKTHSMS